MSRPSRSRTPSPRTAAQRSASAARDLLPLLACIQPEAPVMGEVVELYADGACDTAAGHGGWAAILRSGDHELELGGHAEGTTNNHMEPTGLLEGLRTLKRPCQVRVITD
ncbi:MAG: RNase H family protein, partial [Deinococcus sp.]